MGLIGNYKKEEKMDNELSEREKILIEEIRKSKNPKKEITYLISYRGFLRAGKPRLLFLPAPHVIV